MKHVIFYILLICLPIAGGAANASSLPEASDGKRVLIINSYSKQVSWSNQLTDSLSSRIFRQHPEWQVYTGNLNTENATYTSAAAYTLRSILWGYAERTRTKVEATDSRLTSIFVQDDMPDVLVWIGEEVFLHYLRYTLQLGRWKHIPMVVCAVGDSVSSYGWTPERTFRFDRKYGIREYNVVTSDIDVNSPFIKECQKDKDIQISPVVINGKQMSRLSVYLNYSGVTVFPPIRENLQLIHRLMPDLEELIWVDNDSYSSVKSRLKVEELLKEIMPNVKYTKMIHNSMNTDSIYNVMLQPADHRAFLTHGWNIDALHSKRSDKQMDSLFTHVSTVPLFSLTKRDFKKDNYWIGGYYLSHPEMIDKTVALMERALRGDSLMMVPFDTVQGGKLVLNRTAIERYGLAQAADRLEDVFYVHIPPSFVQKYERQLLLAGLVLVLMVCYAVIAMRRRRYNSQLRADYARYKRLYDKLQVIYENCSIDFALYDKQGRRLLRIVNGEAATAGNKENDLFSENIFESTCLTAEQKELLPSGQVINCEISVPHAGDASGGKASDRDIYQLIVKPLREVDYRSARLIAIAINLSPVIRERKEKEHFERLFRFAADSSQVGVIFYDVATAAGMATSSWSLTMNEAFASGTYPTYAQVVHEDRAQLLKYQQEVRAGRKPEPLCREIRVTGSDGKEHWVRQHMYYVEESNRLIELSLNIDQQKHEEHALEVAKVKAEQSNEETRQFLSSISHEVRTPLNSIVGFSTLLAAVDDEESKHEFIPIILHNARLLDALITNILDLSALDAGTVRFQYAEVDVADLFAEMEAYIHTNMYDCPLRIICEVSEDEEERVLHTDRKYLRLLLLNLLSNAVKFTAAGSIRLACRKEEGRFCFSVTDTGCGIAEEDRKRIFNRFCKLDSYVQGTGLGLSLCKSIVEHLGGEIGVTSEVGKGSTFWFSLSPDPSPVARGEENQETLATLPERGV